MSNAFVEKPDQTTAQRYVAEGYLWNSGIFIASCEVLLKELATFAPRVKLTAEAAVATAKYGQFGLHLGNAFKSAPKISIDYAIMEKTGIASVLPVSFEWSDLGSWDALHAALPKDVNGNVMLGDCIELDTHGSLVISPPNILTSVVGLRDAAVIIERDSVLVCALDRSQSVKQVVAELHSRALPQVDFVDAAAASPAAGRSPEALRPWLESAILPLWWSVGADPSWGFHESLDSNGQPTSESRRCRVQARQAFVYATAGQMGWPGPCEQAATHGLEALFEKYRRADGLFRTLVSADGAILDGRAMTYDQAFVLLALASASWIDPSSEPLALDILKILDETRRNANGGYFEEDEKCLSNPHMHLFEAAIAWIEVGGRPQWYELAQGIARLALNRFYDERGGFIREYFDESWRPAAGELGTIIEPGHQFEWSWLLERWARLDNDRTAAAAARQLYKAGRRGVDASRGVAVDQLTDSFNVRNARARLWVQTEWLTAATILSEHGSNLDDGIPAADVKASTNAVWRYLDQRRPGLWYDKLQPDGSFTVEASPASSLYHIVAAIKQIEDSACASVTSIPRQQKVARG